MHAPGSLVTYEPQWGSDVFGMYQSMVEGRRVPWELLVKDVPDLFHHNLDYLVEQLDWDKNVDPEFKKHNYLEPIVRSGGGTANYVDKWIVYGRVNGKQLFSACELTVEPGGSVTLKDPGAYGLIVVQGSGTIGKLAVDSPNFIRFGEVTQDEVFVSAKRAAVRSEVPQHGKRALCQPPLLRPRHPCRSAGGRRPQQASQVRCRHVGDDSASRSLRNPRNNNLSSPVSNGTLM